MYERLLNKQEPPTFEEMIAYSGESGPLWLELEQHLEGIGLSRLQIRFPYGKDYGWGAKYGKKSKHICDVFAENGAFTALFQVSEKAMETVLHELDGYAKEIWADRSPCASGGWISFRVLNQAHLQDLAKILEAKTKTR